ncbi:MAG: ABC-type nitrate/sulfonate/bicarbonate transport system, periplasmic component [Deltaproteobacteria bacterium]|nr:ABC-type nitrate/sulfonate/bicarbonate transport system, periplasmic component [Deltaproteobacteria bacterium]
MSIVQAGAISSNLAAMRGGRIQAAILSYPAIIQARREGFRELLDIASLAVPYASTGITVRRSFMAQRRDAVTNYVMSILEATARIKKDKPFAIDTMMKCFRTRDRQMMEEAYEVSVNKYLKRLPTPEAFRFVVDERAQVNPKAKGQYPKRFYDDSIL